MIGQIIGNYKIEEKLGEGGMGAVYRGVDTMLDREVAIKALRPELASQTSVVERFRTEAVTLAKLNHPNIATLYSMFRQGEELYMVLEFVRGETLDSIMEKRGALPAEEAIPVFCQVLDGIDHAHELGIVHRDIKPANMMLTEKGTLKVLDFGIARLLGSARMTRAGNIIGTLEYMAPEQVRGHETDGRSDLYALGMMLYEVLTGKLPFDTDNEFELMKSQTEMTPRAPREINPNIPELVEAAIMKAIEKNPDDRFQTGGEFRAVLMNAGFAEATMHGATGTHARLPTRPSHAPLSSPEKAPAAAASTPKSTRLAETTAQPAAAKATRLGVPAPAANVKSTRLGVSAPAAEAVPSTEADPSFFSKLTAAHYAAAGVLLLVLMGGAVAVPFMMSGSKTADNKAANTKSEVKTEAPSQKPDIVTMPAAQTPAASTADAPVQTPPASSGSSLSTDQPGELSPVGPRLKEEKPAASAPKTTAPVKREAPAPKPAAPKSSRAEKLLTGD
jgi:Protein kinase domain